MPIPQDTSASPQRGASLTESLIVLALITWFVALTVPAVSRLLLRARLGGAARDLRNVFVQARFAAAVNRAQVGVVFDGSRDWCWTLVIDGNGNGIRSSEVRSGIDRTLNGPECASERHRGVRVEVLKRGRIPRIPPDRGFLPDLDPVQFGPTDIVSFSPSGSCTPGTVYLSYGRERMAAVRINGWTGRIRLLDFDPETRSWRRW